MNHEGSDQQSETTYPNEPRKARSFDGTPPDPPDGSKGDGYPVIVVDDPEVSEAPPEP